MWNFFSQIFIFIFYQAKQKLVIKKLVYWNSLHEHVSMISMINKQTIEMMY